MDQQEQSSIEQMEQVRQVIFSEMEDGQITPLAPNLHTFVLQTLIRLAQALHLKRQGVALGLNTLVQVNLLDLLSAPLLRHQLLPRLRSGVKDRKPCESTRLKSC